MEGSAELTRLCKVNGLDLPHDKLDLLNRYVGLLLDWNSKINLISRQDEANVWIRHILHSLSLLFHIPIPPHARVLDIGTGGGLPGIPLAIMKSDADFCLLDSIHKKIRAIEEMVAQLDIPNVDPICTRVEDLNLTQRKLAGFDIIIARAVAPVRELIKWSIPLARRHSRHLRESDGVSMGSLKMRAKLPILLAMKGGNLEEEIASANRQFKEKQISSLNLSIQGLSNRDFIDKKLIVVEL